MFGFGFIMSVIFFSLSSADFLPPPNRPLSMKLVLYRASAKKKETKRFLQTVPLATSCPALGEQGVYILGTVTG